MRKREKAEYEDDDLSEMSPSRRDPTPKKCSKKVICSPGTPMLGSQAVINNPKIPVGGPSVNF
jgi:hypothetical protein